MAGSNHKPIKVLMTADTVGGVWSYCIELCRMLPHVQFHLATAGAKLSKGQWEELEGLQNVVVHQTEYKLEWMEKPWSDIDESGEWLLELEEQIQPHLVHLNSYSYGVLPFNATKIVVAHSDVFSWWHAVKGEMPTPDWDEYYNRVKQGLECADLVVAPSKAMMQNLREIYHFTSTSKVIYNGRSKEQFFIGEKQPSVFSMGRVWDEAKNIQLLSKAAAKINYNIQVAGDQQFAGNAFEQDVSQMHFLGRLNAENIAEELSQASLFVLPARYEPFGLSVLEAAYSGCALVLGDISSLREIWENAAVYVDVDDEEALAKTINELMCDTERLKHYQLMARKRAENFSAATMATEYGEVYRQSMQKKQAYLKQQTV